jgi:hypothetical protein
MRYSSKPSNYFPRRRIWKVSKPSESRIKDLWVPLGSLFVALMAVVGGQLSQFQANRQQARLKEYELSFKPKQEGYAEFMRTVLQMFDTAVAHHPNPDKIKSEAARLETIYFSLEPFFTTWERDVIWNKIMEYSSSCYDLYDSPPFPSDEEKKARANLFLGYRGFFRETLYDALFRNPSPL